MFMTSPPAVALGQEENKTVSQQSKLFRLKKQTAGTFQGKGSSIFFLLTVKLLFDDCWTLAILKNRVISSEVIIK